MRGDSSIFTDMPIDPFFHSTTKRKMRPLSTEYQEAFDKAVRKDLKKSPLRAPRRKFDDTNEKQRHLAAIEKIETKTIQPAKPESVEMQIGRSDFKLGQLQTDCPFPESDFKPSDASEWHRGWLAEKQIERAFQEENTPIPRRCLRSLRQSRAHSMPETSPGIRQSDEGLA